MIAVHRSGCATPMAPHSITSSAIASNDGGTVRPSVLEDLLLARLPCRAGAFAVKPAPSARRDAALGLTARRGRANPATVPVMHSLRCSGNQGTRLSDNVRQVECWFSQVTFCDMSLPLGMNGSEPDEPWGRRSGCAAFLRAAHSHLHRQVPGNSVVDGSIGGHCPRPASRNPCALSCHLPSGATCVQDAPSYIGWVATKPLTVQRDYCHEDVARECQNRGFPLLKRIELGLHLLGQTRANQFVGC
jgi:hypothetical protein